MVKQIALFLTTILFISAAYAAPAALTYQGRILKADGSPLEYKNVSFIFQITDLGGTCVLYQEQVDGQDMTNSGGVFDTAIGLGTRNYPTTGVFTILDSLNNTAALNCQGGSTYTPQFTDGRILRVQFYDGTGWKIITPDNIIRSVPYAGYAVSSAKLGNNVAGDFILKAGLPTCTTGTFLSWDGTALSCAPVAGASGGTVTNVTANAPLMVGSGSTTPVLSISQATTSTNGYLSSTDWNTFNSKLGTATAFVGDVSGTYGATSVDKIKGTAVTITSLASGNLLKFDGTAWVNSTVGISDISGLTTQLGNKLDVSNMPASCAASQTLTFSSPSGAWVCSTIAVTGTAFGSQSANLVFASPDSASGTASFRALTANDLPAAVSSGLWTASGANVYRASGNVGIGTNSPLTALDIDSSSNSVLRLLSHGTSAGNGSFLRLNYSRGTQAAPAIVTSSDRLGALLYQAYDGTTYVTTSRIDGNMDGVPAAGDMPSNLTFFTTPAGTATPVERLRINSAGNIGIGTATPTYNLDVYGNGRFTSPVYHNAGNATSPGVTFSAYPHTGAFAAGADIFAITTASSERMRIDATGNVGIGTTAPGRKVDIAQTDSNNALLRMTSVPSVAGTSYEAATEFYTATTSAVAPLLSGRIASNFVGTSYTNTVIKLQNATTGGVLIDTMTLANGKVGIGTATPGVALDVVGTVRATAFSGPLTSTTTSVGAGTNGAPSMTFSGDATTGFYDASSNGTISVATTGTKIFDFNSTGLVSPTTGGANITTGAGTVGAPTFSFAGDAGTGWWRPAAGTMAASTGGVERMRIDSAGRVGIGTSPSVPLDVNGSIRSSNGTYFQAGTVAATSLIAMTATLNANSATQDSVAQYQPNVVPQQDITGFYGMIFLPTFSGSANNVTAMNGLYSRTDLAASYTGTIGTYNGIVAADPVISGGAITNVRGIVSSIASGTNKYNLYVNGTAPNYFAGNVGIGTGPATTSALTVSSSTVSSPTVTFTNPTAGASQYGGISVGADTIGGLIYATSSAYTDVGLDANPVANSLNIRASAAATGGLILITANGSGDILMKPGGAEKFRIKPNGNVGLGTAAPASELSFGSSFSNTRGGYYATGAPDGTSRNDVLSVNEVGEAKYGFGIHSNTLEIFTPQTIQLGKRLTDGTGTLSPYLTIATTGNVGIGSTGPTAKLEVVGAIKATTYIGGGYNATAATAIDWSLGNAQYTSADCGAMTFTNMQDGAAYTLTVTGTNAGTCSFSQSGLTFKYPPNHGITSAGTMTVYSFQRNGSNVMVAWIPGY